MAVPFWKGSDVTDTDCCPPSYPVPAEVTVTVPKPFLRTTNDLVEKQDASDEPNNVLSWNPAILRAPWITLPNDIDLLTSK